MKTFVAIPVFDINQSEALEDLLNSLLMTPVLKNIFIVDVTKYGLDKNSEMRSLIRAYMNYGVGLIEVKGARKECTNDYRMNMAMATSIMRFNHHSTYDSFIFVDPSIRFDGFDLQIFVDNTQLYNAISPVVETIDGLEIWRGIFDRWGIEFLSCNEQSLSLITGAVEDSYALNPKCFGLSKRYANRLRDFTYSQDDPKVYLNSLIYDHGSTVPKVDTALFVHENLY